MGSPKSHAPVLFLIVAFSRYPEALTWGQEQAEAAYGPIALQSDYFDFSNTQHYSKEMGTGLKKQIWAFEHLMEVPHLVDRKLCTNAWEAEYATLQRHVEPRPLNLDAGYLTIAKLVLATTKDHSHRLYLDRGILAEVTLTLIRGKWKPWPWTYPDYAAGHYHAFLWECRSWLRERYREQGIS